MGIGSALARTAQTRARHIAFICNNRVRTWGELGKVVPHIAGGLHRLGISPGGRVAVLAHNNDRYFELFLSVPHAGGVIVPLNTRWSIPELSFAISGAEPTILAVDDELLDTGRALARKFPSLTLVSIGEAGADDIIHYTSLASGPPLADAQRTGDDLYGIFYTGGTTGHSKGVMLSHRNVLMGAIIAHREGYYREDAVYLVAAPFFHASGSWPLIGLTVSGGTAIILPSFEPGEALCAIERHRVTESLFVPTMIQMLIEHQHFRQTDLRSLKTIIYGASPITTALLDRAVELLPHVELTQAYGMTELSPQVTALHHKHLLPENRMTGRYRSAGRACYGVEVKIVDENDRTLGVGEVGEICARGENVMQGYWALPEETAHTLRNGWMHTGDSGRLDEDGFVYVVDRVKDMIISGGENVYSTEVENALAQHPAVRQCVVIGIPSDVWVEQVHAIIILHDGAIVTEDELIIHARSLVAGYKVPRSIEFRTEPFPLSPANKILKRDLRAPFWAGRGSNIA